MGQEYPKRFVTCVNACRNVISSKAQIIKYYCGHSCNAPQMFLNIALSNIVCL